MPHPTGALAPCVMAEKLDVLMRRSTGESRKIVTLFLKAMHLHCHFWFMSRSDQEFLEGLMATNRLIGVVAINGGGARLNFEADVRFSFSGKEDSQSGTIAWTSENRELLKSWMGSRQTQFIFDEAQPILRRLSKKGIRVERPICLMTCRQILQEDDDHERSPVKDQRDAEERAFQLIGEMRELTDRLKEAGLHRVAQLENSVLSAFAAMESMGLYIDTNQWRELVAIAKRDMTAAQEAVLRELASVVNQNLFGEPDINLDADFEVKTALERLMQTSLDDVSKHTLVDIDHPIIEPLLKYREHRKIVSTYGEEFLLHVQTDTSRIHSSFIPIGASTGRVASREPNLQNLPAGRKFHACICAPPGQKLITADYATCELRILAGMSDDKGLIEAFSRGDDVHSVVAQTMFKEEVSKTQNAHLRNRAKAIQFGIIYGMGAASLGKSLEISEQEARDILEHYFQTYPKVRTFLKDLVEKALKRGYSETLLGRKLYFSEEALASPNARQELGRIAKNMPIQGTSADMIKIAMTGIHRALCSHKGAYLVNTIHDELVVECSETDAEAVADVVKHEMSEAHRFLLPSVPPLVDLAVGDDWSH